MQIKISSNSFCCSIPQFRRVVQGRTWDEIKTTKDVANGSQSECPSISALNKRRIKTIQSVCKTFGAEGNTKSLKKGGEIIRSDQLIPGVVENSEMRFFFCRINKAGITSTLRFFASMNYNRTLAVYRSKINNDRQAFFLETNDFPPARPKAHGIGVDHRSYGTYVMTNGITLQYALGRFRDYRKLLIVRHPLQRLVSAYYEKRMSQETFPEFVKNRVLTSNDKHWLDYQSSCHPCQMEYDFILQQENIDEEFSYVKKRLGLNPGYPYPRANVHDEEKQNDVYRHDNTLRELEKNEAALFGRILLKYKVDMDMFGYYWRNHKSGRIRDSRLCSEY